MCYGFQEWYTHCRHGGVFHITNRCFNKECYILIEENAAHLYGWCPLCPGNGEITPNLPQRELTRFASIQDLDRYYEREMQAVISKSELLTVQYQVEMANGGKFCWAPAILHKKSVQHFAYLGDCRKKDIALYRADDMAKNDMNNYGQAAGVQRV